MRDCKQESAKRNLVANGLFFHALIIRKFASQFYSRPILTCRSSHMNCCVVNGDAKSLAYDIYYRMFEELLVMWRIHVDNYITRSINIYHTIIAI